MSIFIDVERGRKVARHLYDSFTSTGIHGRTDMPEDLVPRGIERGSLEHLLFITLTVSIDYQRDAPQLWSSSRKTYGDEQTKYLYFPKLLNEISSKKIIDDMQKYMLSKKPIKDANIWRTVALTFYKKWGGNPKNFLEDCKWDSLTILNRLREDVHIYNERKVPDYPYLRGPKIGPLWIRMLRDNVGIETIRNLERVPIPVDIHVVRATLTTGVVRGKFEGKLEEIFGKIRKAWFESVSSLNVKNRAMIALDIDEPLWHLSKYGCSKRDKQTGFCPVKKNCEARDFCVSGFIKLKKNFVELDT